MIDERVIEAADAAYHHHLRNALPRIVMTDDRVALTAVNRGAMDAAITAADRMRAHLIGPEG